MRQRDIPVVPTEEDAKPGDWHLAILAPLRLGELTRRKLTRRIGVDTM
jgi:hypothetical protein